MYRKPTKEELAQQALDYLEQAEKFEVEMNWPKAMENYNNAAEFLKKSGYLNQKIEDIYSRMTKLNNYIQQEKLHQQSRIINQQAQLEQFQDEAFNFLDEAKKFEEKENFEDAVIKYMAAIKFLVEAGWTETQLENIKSKIISLAQNLEMQKLIPQQKAVISSQQLPKGQIQPQSLRSSISIPPITDEKTKALKTYEIKRKEQEIRQNRAFALMEQSKKFEKDMNFDQAIINYQEAIELLNSIGWELQTQNIQIIIEKLKRDKKDYEKIQAQEQKQPVLSIEELSSVEPPIIISEVEKKKLELVEFEKQQRLEEKLRIKGFKLIEEGKRKVYFREFDKAYQYFNEAISLFKEIGWNDQINLIENQINQTKSLEEEIKREELKVQKIQKELERQRKLEIERWKKEDQNLTQMISEVGSLTDDIEAYIEIKKRELKLLEERKKEQIKSEAKEFSKDLRKIIQLKQEIQSKLARKEELFKEMQKETQKAKERKELDEIARMIKEVAKKKKK